MSDAESTGSSSFGDKGEKTKMKPSRNLTLGIPSYEDHKQESPPNTNLTLAVPSHEDHKQKSPPNTNLTLAVASNQDLSSKTTVEVHGKGISLYHLLSKRSRTIQDAMTGLTLAVGSRQDDHFGKTTGNITASPPENEAVQHKIMMIRENFLFEKKLSLTDAKCNRLLLPRASWYHFPALEIKTNTNEGSSNPNMTQTYYFNDQIQDKKREMTVTNYDDQNIYIRNGWSAFANDHKLNADDVVRFYKPTQSQQGDFLLNYKRAKPTDNDGNGNGNGEGEGEGEGKGGSGNTDHDQAQG
ncbi:hypothetical protein F0562_002278 [Nyssa sinensis]|uniref:TF-B3 domain-containing protein n=1 Tax=Nyssa sinensis TaxID=561372 RepID=A0A5J5C6X6_9ASTE|nr:hypothetical protein F0562_002278 [Nyssa sinensis]